MDRRECQQRADDGGGDRTQDRAGPGPPEHNQRHRADNRQREEGRGPFGQDHRDGERAERCRHPQRHPSAAFDVASHPEHHGTGEQAAE